METINLDLTNEDLQTLSECNNKLREKGFNKDFQVVEEGLKETDADTIYSPKDVKILNFYRFEGESDPADMSILYAIEVSSGDRGTLVDAFGTYSGTKVSNFIRQVEDIYKKTDSEEEFAPVETHVSIGK